MHYDRVHRGGDPTGRFTAEGDRILTPLSDGSCGSGYYIDHGYHGCVPIGTRASWDENGDAGEDETKGAGGAGYGEGPPDGSDEIKVVYRGKFLGHEVQILAKGRQLGIKVGAKFQVVEFPDINQLVLAAAELTKRVGV